jgi:hypothetical protein
LHERAQQIYEQQMQQMIGELLPVLRRGSDHSDPL